MKTPTIQVWHGAHRWSGSAEIRPLRNGFAQCGNGIYCTTSARTAVGYAKGGGSLMRFSIDASIRLLDQTQVVSIDAAQEIVQEIYKGKSKSAMLYDIDELYKKNSSCSHISALFLPDIAVANNCSHGAAGVALTRWLHEVIGVDARVYEQNSSEDWLIIFNPRIVTHAKKASLTGSCLSEFPSIKNQI